MYNLCNGIGRSLESRKLFTAANCNGALKYEIGELRSVNFSFHLLALRGYRIDRQRRVQCARNAMHFGRSIVRAVAATK